MIRKMRDTDIEAVMEIWFSSTVKAHPFIDVAYWEKNYSLLKNEYLPQSQTLVFEEDNIIKGFISVIDNSFIGALFISPEFQGHGLGRKLLEAISSQSKELTLAVYADNQQAISFYKKMGFEIIHHQLDASSGKFEYLMKKKDL